MQVYKQCEKQIPAFALEPVREATEELDLILQVIPRLKFLFYFDTNAELMVANTYVTKIKIPYICQI